ncbi:MAG: tautomerase family protein [Proteobacteria bacterium]|uniref:4-oxalocrotonate tautomerase family protein n=1 Tax=Rudaea sp. TaxID=2136325 RepID=UPI001DC8B1FA|nr:tautomerase family protein [Pseudomonadota bacterium]MBS0567141.1 tautomerase family protein [Pseudomonadota bacterium]
MPEIVVYALEGRTPAQKEALMKAITEVTAQHFAVPAAGIVVQIVEAKADSKSKGGVPYAKRG